MSTHMSYSTIKIQTRPTTHLEGKQPCRGKTSAKPGLNAGFKFEWHIYARASFHVLLASNRRTCVFCISSNWTWYPNQWQWLTYRSQAGLHAFSISYESLVHAKPCKCRSVEMAGSATNTVSSDHKGKHSTLTGYCWKTSDFRVWFHITNNLCMILNIDDLASRLHCIYHNRWTMLILLSFMACDTLTTCHCLSVCGASSWSSSSSEVPVIVVAYLRSWIQPKKTWKTFNQ